jgi:putative flippase GtrA
MQKLANIPFKNSYKYLIVGFSAFLVQYGSFFVCLRILHWQLLVANSIGFCLSLVVSFTLNRSWSFKKAEFRKAAHHQAVLYGVLAGLNLILTNAILGFLKHIGLNPLIGELCVIAMVASWNFFLFHLVIFSGSTAPDEEKAR